MPAPDNLASPCLLALLEQLLGCMLRPAAVIDANGTVLCCNPSWRALQQSTSGTARFMHVALPAALHWLPNGVQLAIADRRARSSLTAWKGRASHRRSDLAGAPHSPQLPVALTAREREVAGLIAKGLRNAEIAAALGVSAHTARRHTESVLRKLDVRTRSAVSAALWRVEPPAQQSGRSSRFDRLPPPAL